VTCVKYLDERGQFVFDNDGQPTYGAWIINERDTGGCAD
jgi:hypothetical protein